MAETWTPVELEVVTENAAKMRRRVPLDDLAPMGARWVRVGRFTVVEVFCYDRPQTVGIGVVRLNPGDEDNREQAVITALCKAFRHLWSQT